jgi:hypothetical protein
MSCRELVFKISKEGEAFSRAAAARLKGSRSTYETHSVSTGAQGIRSLEWVAKLTERPFGGLRYAVSPLCRTSASGHRDTVQHRGTEQQRHAQRRPV